jgi:hypothetical protein
MWIYIKKFIWSNTWVCCSRKYQSCVCKLKKALYGLKQSPWAWFGKFFAAVMEFGAQHCQIDHSVFHLHTIVGYILLMVYVNDIVITSDDLGGIA